MNLENDEQIERLTDLFARMARNFHDLQNEIAGRNVGRIECFLPDGAKSADASGKAKQERAQDLTRLQLALMSDPAYAALYRETTQALNDAQSRLDRLLEQVQREIEATHTALEDMRNRAARLEDGTHVYRDKNGAVHSEDGQIIDDARAEGIVWRGDEPTYESMQDARERAERLQDIEHDIRSGQAEIGDMQSGMENEDDPKSAEELEGFKKRADEIVEGAEDSIDEEMKRKSPLSDVPEPAVQAASDIEVPKL